MIKTKLLLSLLLSLPCAVFAEFSELIPVHYYGWLDQYSVNARHGLVGPDACVPTSSTNALTFLQNVNPWIFGTTLSGVTYKDWEETSDILVSFMNTRPNKGTYDDRFVWGLDTYIALTRDFPQVQFSGIFPPNDWDPAGGYPQPDFIETGIPDIGFISNALGAGSALLVGITYNDGTTGGGHELLFNGLTWDPVSNTGTVYFVDPLDPSQHYSPDVPTGPVLQTVGDLRVNEDGSLELHYRQYHGSLPYTDRYLEINAKVTSVLAVGGSFYGLYDECGWSKNTHSIIRGFTHLDPTTSCMFPIVAVLNTTPCLENAFDQLDPSIYNNLFYSAEDVAHQLQTILNINLLQYRNVCGSISADHAYRAWLVPFENLIYQKGGHNATRFGYRNSMSGGVLGLDYRPCRNWLAGCGISYAYNKLKWNDAHASSNNNSYGAFLYGASLCAPLWVDVAFEAFYNRTNGRRKIFIPSAIPCILPIDRSIHYKNNSSSYSGHLAISYDFCLCNQGTVFPFLSVDYTRVQRGSISEKGGGLLDLKIDSKGSNLLRSEAGLGFGYCLCNSIDLQTKLAYANVYRFGGKKSTAYFDCTPCSEFSVDGSLFQNNLFCITLLLGSSALNDCTNVNLTYHGEFGSRFSLNEVSAELSIAF